MTTLLERAFNKASTLNATLQDELAEQWLTEIEWEVHWEATLAQSQDMLNQMAMEALREYHAGKTVKKGFDEL
jgi:hypothetical protein